MWRIAMLVVLTFALAAAAGAEVTWSTVFGPVSEPTDAVDHVGTDGTSLYVVFSNPWNQQGGGQQFWKYSFGADDPLNGTWTRLANPPRTVCSSDSCSDLAYQDGYLYTSAAANNGGRTVLRYSVAGSAWEVWQNGGVDVNTSSTTGNGIFMDPSASGVGYSACAGGGWWVQFDWLAKTANNNWMSTAGLGVTDAGWISRNEDVAVAGGTYYATKNDTSAGLSSGDVVYTWNSLSSPVPTVLAAKPWQAGFGQAIEVIPGTISPSGHDELWLVRGADGSTNPGEGYGNVTSDWARLDLTNVAGGWTSATLPNPVAYSGEIIRIGRCVFIRGQFSRWYVTVQYHLTSIAAAKQVADGVSLDTSGVVTASFPAVGQDPSQFYIEEPSRACGIQVRYSGTLPSGAVSISGTMRTDAQTRERYIEAAGWSPNGTADPVKPVGMHTRALGGGACGRQEGVYGGQGLSNIGLLVTVSGKVSARVDGDGYYYVFDGAEVSDGGSASGVKVEMGAVPIPSRVSGDMNDQLVVTGICCAYVGPDGNVHPRIRVRSGTDCRNLSFKKYKTLVLDFDPRVPSEQNKRIHEVFGWWNPTSTCQSYISDLNSCSGGFAQYDVVEWYDANYLPRCADGYQYTPDEFVQTYRNGGPWLHYMKTDFYSLIRDKSYPHNNPKNIAERVAAGEVDEVFLFGPLYGGNPPYWGADYPFWEASMAGPDPYFVNGEVCTIPEAGRNFILMGFNYERDVDCMLENFLHRSELIMDVVYDPPYPISWPVTNNWDRFRIWDQVEPDEAGCGTCHYAPNSRSDYDWGNTRYVWSKCDDWLYNWPNLQGYSTRRWVNCTEWGSGSMTLHHLWWLKHVPKRAGVNPDGKQNNWWKYFCDYNSYPESQHQ